MEKTKLSEFEQGGYIGRLFIESYDFPEDIELTETWGIITDAYEIGCRRSDGVFHENLTYSIHEVDGRAFKISGDNPIDMRYITILTEWEEDDEGNLEEVIIPDEPYDEGSFTLTSGTYRVWDEITEL